MGIPRKRERYLAATSGMNVISNRYFDPYQTSGYSFKGYESIQDENNMFRMMRELQKARPELRTVDIGCEMSHTKATIEEPGPYVDWTLNDAYSTRFRGRLFAWHTNLDYKSSSSAWKPFSVKSDQEMDRLGSTAISTVAPTNPHVDLATTFGELYRDGLPALPGSQSLRHAEDFTPQNLSGEYLNYQFGVAPMVSDLKKIVATAKNAEKHIKQYLRDSGRIVRRQYRFPEEITSESTVVKTGNYCPAGPSVDFYLSPGTVKCDVETKVNTWFSGAFTYYADPRSVGPVLATIAQAQHLTGLRPDIESLYNLTPWSWAIDWFTNLGDVVNNVSMFAQDGLIMHWGYVMRETTQTVTYRMEGARSKFWGPITADQVLVLKHQRRRRATPFGFGLLEEDFTPRQWAILAALGISKGSDRLRSM